ncbi:MAG: hypothetical protein GY774_35460 [Planctomycetes bacterium]|nr:hypothetical protein [Planctomycetota bacterium]
MNDIIQPDDKDIKLFEKRAPGVPEKVSDHSVFGPSDVLALAIQNNYAPEFIEKMMDLQERHERNEAKKAHFAAVATFKAESPPVKKDKYNEWLKCWYTSLGALLDTYTPVLGEHGLSVSFSTPQQTETTMTVECHLAHSMGHVETKSLTGPIDTAAVGKQSGKASRTPMQDVRSTFTYLRATTLEAVLGVSGTEATQDDDGNAGGPEYITKKQVANIKKLMADKQVDESMFLVFAEADSIEKIEVKKFGDVIDALRRKKAPTTREPGSDDS